MSQESIGKARARAALAAELVGFSLTAHARQILDGSCPPRRATGVRKVVMYLLGTVFGMSHAQVATAVDRDRSTVSAGIRRVENCRDDVRFDRWLEQLEECLRAAPEPQQ